MSSSPLPLPEYTVRTSARARRIGLRVLPGRGLEVVLPLRADPGCVPEVLRRHRGWIDKALARMGGRAPRESGRGEVPAEFYIKGGRERIVLAGCGREAAPAGEGGSAPLPKQAKGASGEFCASGSGFSGDVAATDGKQGGFRASGLTEPPPSVRVLALPDRLYQPAGVAGLGGGDAFIWLREWVRKEARAYLGPRLDALAALHGLAHAGCSVRFQRTRWGSCSARGSISLNGCLLFLPENLTRYILLHELCHTRELNHSAAYWRLLFALEPDALALDRRMRSAWKYVPPWALS